MPDIRDDFIEQMKLYFHKLTTDYLFSVFGEEKGKLLFTKYHYAFQSFFEKNLHLMNTNLSKRHGINSIFVLALDKAFEKEELSHQELKTHVIAIYKIMMQSLLENQVKQLESSEDPWYSFVKSTKAGNAQLYENEYFQALTAFDEKSVFGIDIKKCLYFEIFQANDRPNLGPILCAYDYLLASAVDKWIRFERTETIVDGFNRCDFRYYPKDSIKKKLIDNPERIKDLILVFVHKETGWGDPLKPQCEFDDLYVREITMLDEEKISVTFEYHFDEDGFSMYPRNHILEGEAILDVAGSILSFKLEETYTGPASVEDPYKTKKE
ncbi:MAG: L-2-amino-thiazoline-4-carboxylic acid hydrolase [Candidatus Heimdallarchaeota archaeon]|nr:L-2-amino-thiazoline-4-carboxylic acid hydrolase [Candidatus Heimdallarchaeota archaeon]MCK5297360.1 L-2-amino-thiazoline-4-carboxylic acid hydrolase [Candidatus Heimdallarchaeota archaeon]